MLLMIYGLNSLCNDVLDKKTLLKCISSTAFCWLLNMLIRKLWIMHVSNMQFLVVNKEMASKQQRQTLFWLTGVLHHNQKHGHSQSCSSCLEPELWAEKSEFTCTDVLCCAERSRTPGREGADSMHNGCGAHGCTQHTPQPMGAIVMTDAAPWKAADPQLQGPKPGWLMLW